MWLYNVPMYVLPMHYNVPYNFQSSVDFLGFQQVVVPLQYPFRLWSGTHFTSPCPCNSPNRQYDNIIVCTWGPPQIHCASMKKPAQNQS